MSGNIDIPFKLISLSSTMMSEDAVPSLVNPYCPFWVKQLYLRTSSVVTASAAPSPESSEFPLSWNVSYS